MNSVLNAVADASNGLNADKSGQRTIFANFMRTFHLRTIPREGIHSDAAVGIGIGKDSWKMKQEAQLMLTTGSTRLAVSRGQQIWYHSTCYILFPIVQ